MKTLMMILLLPLLSALEAQGEQGNPNPKIGETEPAIVVGGQVRTPGSFPFSHGMTLFDAVQIAGGATEFGSLKRVTVYRKGMGKRYDVTQKEAMEIKLEPEDLIDIPQKEAMCGC